MPNSSSSAQAGVNNLDKNQRVEKPLSFPWISDKSASYVAYQNRIEIDLDAGMALHKPLPQSSQYVDTLASVYITDKEMDQRVAGANLKSKGSYKDVIQRMATSTYTFKLIGFALRVAYKIPIPGLRSVAGVAATPGEFQNVVDNLLVGNYSGIPMFFARWELWYYVVLPPKSEQVPPPNLAAHIKGDIALPKADEGLPLPYSGTDPLTVSTMQQPADLDLGPSGLSGFTSQ